MTHINRSLEPVLLELLMRDVSATGCILVEGARQVGKTTLVQTVLEKLQAQVFHLDLEDNHRFRLQIDACEDFQDFTDLLADNLGFKHGGGEVLFIDEAQESKGLGRFVRYMKERWQGTRVVLTGSSMTRLFRDDVRYPVRRVTRFHVPPFDFLEYLRAVDQADLADFLVEKELAAVSRSRHHLLLQHFDNFLAVGGMPDVVLTNAAGGDYQTRRAELIADLHHDFLRLFGEEDVSLVMQCLRSVANFAGSPSKISTVLDSESRKSRKTAENIFSRLEQWSLVLASSQMGPYPESSHAFHPKRYLFDTGILRHWRESTVPGIGIRGTVDAAQRRPLGGVLENQVAIALHHQWGSLKGWKRSSTGSEIDFISGNRDGKFPVECKAALEIKLTHLKGLRVYLDLYDLPVGYVVSFDRYRKIAIDGRTVVNIPAYGISCALENVSDLF